MNFTKVFLDSSLECYAKEYISKLRSLLETSRSEKREGFLLDLNKV